MRVEQPVLDEYLHTVGSAALSEVERGLIIDLGIAVWHIMKQGAGPLPTVRRETLAGVERKNTAMLDYLQGEPEEEFERTVRLIVEHYNQTAVLKFVLDAIVDGIPGKPRVSDENKGLVLYCLKSIIDAFDAETGR
jgi:hypothetical protein